MSSKKTIMLTKDNEHWYFDFSEPIGSSDIAQNNEAITLEFSKENARVELNDDYSVVITLTNPNSEVYQLFSKISQGL